MSVMHSTRRVHRGCLSPERIAVVLVGAGGTGSHMLTALVQLHLALRALGHPTGLEVIVIDPDEVTESNVGRQMFFPGDVGRFKCEALVTRVNMTYGLAWEALARPFTRALLARNYARPVLVGCVDNRAARKQMAEYFHSQSGAYWLDCGNTDRTGQVVLGFSGLRDVEALPHVGQLFPDLIDPRLDEEDATPSCSLAVSLERQDLFINRAIALAGANLLWKLVREGELIIHGQFIDLNNGRWSPLPVDQVAWARMGYKPRRRKRAA